MSIIFRFGLNILYIMVTTLNGSENNDNVSKHDAGVYMNVQMVDVEKRLEIIDK